MDNSNQPSNASRFITAAVLSLLVLFAWQYFFAPKPATPTDNANTAQTANTTASPVQPTPVAQQNPAQQTVASTPDNAPNKQITIKTPLYEVKLDSKGAVATSWILLKNKSPQGEALLFADGSTESTTQIFLRHKGPLDPLHVPPTRVLHHLVHLQHFERQPVLRIPGLTDRAPNTCVLLDRCLLRRCLHNYCRSANVVLL